MRAHALHKRGIEWRSDRRFAGVDERDVCCGAQPDLWHVPGAVDGSEDSATHLRSDVRAIVNDPRDSSRRDADLPGNLTDGRHTSLRERCYATDPSVTLAP